MEKAEADFAKNSLKSTLYNVKTSKHYSESIGAMNGIGDFVAQSGEVPYDDFEEGNTKTFTHQEFQKGISIERKLRDDSRIVDMQNRSSDIVDSANRTMEKFVHAPFANSGSTTFTLAGGTFSNVGADGKSMINATHVASTSKGSNQSNLVSTAVGIAGLKEVEEKFVGFETDIGEPANVFPDTIFAPFALKDTIYKMIETENEVGTANNDKNPYSQKYNVIISKWLDYLGLTTMAFIIDSVYMKKCLFWLDRIPLEIRSEKDFNTQNWNIAGYMRYSLGFTDWRWVVRLGS